MANESIKDFNAMMKNNKDMPKIQVVEDKKIIIKISVLDITKIKLNI